MTDYLSVTTSKDILSVLGTEAEPNQKLLNTIITDTLPFQKLSRPFIYITISYQFSQCYHHRHNSLSKATKTLFQFSSLSTFTHFSHFTSPFSFLSTAIDTLHLTSHHNTTLPPRFNSVSRSSRQQSCFPRLQLTRFLTSFSESDRRFYSFFISLFLEINISAWTTIKREGVSKEHRYLFYSLPTFITCSNTW